MSLIKLKTHVYSLIYNELNNIVIEIQITGYQVFEPILTFLEHSFSPYIMSKMKLQNSVCLRQRNSDNVRR